MGVKWRQTIYGWDVEDGSALYIVDVPVGIPAQAEPPFHTARTEIQWALVTRHAPHFPAKMVAGPFPTLDGAKAAYVVLAPRYPGP